MTGMRVPLEASGLESDRVTASPATVEVVTVAADTLRASVRISGPLAASACTVLVCVLRAHLRAGRHYLRVDVSGASSVAPEALAALGDMHRQVTSAGGMLIFENAGPQVVDAIRDATLFVRPAI